MALPTVVNVGTVANGVGDITPGLPAGWAQNDIFLAFLECQAADAIVVPSGWAHVTGSPIPHAGALTELTVVWKRAGSSESAPTFTDAGNHQIGRIIAIRGCPTTGDPWDVIATDTAANATAVSVPGATTTVADCLVLAAVSTGSDIASTTEISGWTNASLANLTERVDDWTLDGNGGGVGVASGEKATAGAYSATTATLVTSGAQARLSIALKPAGAGTAHTKNLDDSAAPVDAIGKAPRKAIADGPAVADGVGKAPVVALADSAAPADALAKAAAKSVGEIITPADALSTAAGYVLGLADSASLADDIGKAAAHPLADTAAVADGVSKRPGLNLLDGVSITDALERAWAAQLAIADATALADSVSPNATGAEGAWPWFVGPIDMDPLGFASEINLTR